MKYLSQLYVYNQILTEVGAINTPSNMSRLKLLTCSILHANRLLLVHKMPTHFCHLPRPKYGMLRFLPKSNELKTNYITIKNNKPSEITNVKDPSFY